MGFVFGRAEHLGLPRSIARRPPVPAKGRPTTSLRLGPDVALRRIHSHPVESHV